MSRNGEGYSSLKCALFFVNFVIFTKFTGLKNFFQQLLFSPSYCYIFALLNYLLMQKLRSTLIFTLYILLNPLSAQVYDDFSDGDFTHHPTWEGDTMLFIVNDEQLYLNGDERGIAYLFTHNEYGGYEWEWQFRVKMSFAPSNNNFTRIYLWVNTCDFSSPDVKGVYMQLGEAGNNDVPELFYQEGTQIMSICRGTTPIFSNFDNTFKVLMDSMGHWSLWVDAIGNGLFVLDTTGEMQCAISENHFFCIYCQYTLGNRNRFIFDDIYAGPYREDTIPPQVLKVSVEQQFPSRLLVTFSEAVYMETALKNENYVLQNSMYSPVHCEFVDETHQVVRLYFADAFLERERFFLQIQNVTDIQGVPMLPVTMSFVWWNPHRNDVLITEIMADPSPIVHLPDCEYVELYNTLPFDITLQNWKLLIGNNIKNLPTISLSAFGYGIIVTELCASQFEEYANVYTVSSLTIADDGQRLSLSDGSQIIHSVNFKRTWHEELWKREGGWALEMIDTDNPCEEASNWNSSISPDGGTPERINSIAEKNEDFNNPLLDRVTILDEQHLRVFFNEGMVENDTAKLRSVFHIDRGVQIISAAIVPPDNMCVDVGLSAPLQPQIIYTLTVTDSICDCAGNVAEVGQVAFFALPTQAERGDIVINEVLSNPFEDTDGDYIELYNLSDKVLDMSELLLGIGNGETPVTVVPVVKEGFLLFPHSYIAIAKNKTLTQRQYDTPYPQNVMQNSNLPNYPNDAGVVHLLRKDGLLLDHFSYDKSMHYSGLLTTDGVSLERIHPQFMTQNASNWTSAAESYGWGTPGYRNSQYVSERNEDGKLLVLPDVFSPDNDGNNDFTEIYCKFLSENYRLTLAIYDKNGFIVRHLSKNQICGLNERFVWDGMTDDGRPAVAGIYVVLAQMWNANGKKQILRKAVSLARKE